MIYTTNCRRIYKESSQFFSKKKQEFRKQRRFIKDKIIWVQKANTITIRGYDDIVTTNPSAALMHNWLLGRYNVNPQPCLRKDARVSQLGARRNLGQALAAAIGARQKDALSVHL